MYKVSSHFNLLSSSLSGAILSSQFKGQTHRRQPTPGVILGESGAVFHWLQSADLHKSCSRADHTENRTLVLQCSQVCLAAAGVGLHIENNGGKASDGPTLVAGHFPFRYYVGVLILKPQKFQFH